MAPHSKRPAQHHWKQNAAFVLLLVCYTLLSRTIHVFQDNQLRTRAQLPNEDISLATTQSVWLAMPPRLLVGEAARRLNLRHGRSGMSAWRFHGVLLGINTVTALVPEAVRMGPLQFVRIMLRKDDARGLPLKTDPMSGSRCWWLNAYACYAATTHWGFLPSHFGSRDLRKMRFCRARYGVGVAEAAEHVKLQHVKEWKTEWSENVLMAYTAACAAVRRDFAAWDAGQCRAESAREVVNATNMAMADCAAWYRPNTWLGVTTPHGWTNDAVVEEEVSRGREWQTRRTILLVDGKVLQGEFKNPDGSVNATFMDGVPWDTLMST